MLPRHGARHHVRTGARAVQRHAEIGFRELLSACEDALTDDQLRVFAQHGGGRAHGVIHAADLRGIHRQHRVLFKRRFSYGVDGAQSLALAGADVFFQIQHVRALFEEEAVNAVVARRFAGFGVHAAARHDGHVRARADEEIVVHEVIHVAVGHARGDGHALALCAGPDVNFKAGVICLGIDADVLARLPARAGAVHAKVVRAVERALEAGNAFQQILRNLIH